MRLFLISLVLMAGPVSAQSVEAFFEHHGCTVGPDSRAAAIEAGFSAGEVEASLAVAEEAGQLDRVGAYAVFGPELCTIRLPQIDAVLSVDDPIVQNAIIEVDFEPGCFLRDLPAALEAAGYPQSDYFAFLGAGLLSGELRFYAPTPLETPVGIQVMTGACGDVPAAEPMAEAAAVLTDENFDRYVRLTAQDTPCDDGSGQPNKMAIAADLQLAAGLDENKVNAWLWFEMDLIAWAAWRDGTTWEDRGTMRPPLCDHYP